MDCDATEIKPDKTYYARKNKMSLLFDRLKCFGAEANKL